MDPRHTQIICAGCGVCAYACPRDIPIAEHFTTYNKCVAEPEKQEEWKKRYEASTAERGRASDCIQCCTCESVCRLQLPISRLLMRVADLLE